MSAITSLHARQILDSRGNPTLEVDCTLDEPSAGLPAGREGSGQVLGRAAVPSGASTGTHEALELRDGNKKKYGGLSVESAVLNVNTVIAKKLTGASVSDQRTIDQMLLDLDGTPNKSKLGANAILGVSMAVCCARAVSEGKPLYRSLAEQYDVKNPSLLPIPLMNVLNGGKHADSGLSFQECMIVPTGFSQFSDALRAGAEIFHTLKNILTKRGMVTSVGDEGGFAPHLSSSDEALTLLVEAISAAGYEGKVQLAIDAAASEFMIANSDKRQADSYHVDGKKLSSAELVDYYVALCKKFPIVSIEDSHSEDDWEGFQRMMQKLGKNVQLVGDDLLVTNTERISKAIEKKAANAVLIKLNQIGTVSETVDAIQLAQKNGWRAVVSHRSGETEDTFIAHLAVGLGTGQIKTGSLSRTDRVCKYNELLRIEEELGGDARFENAF